MSSSQKKYTRIYQASATAVLAAYAALNGPPARAAVTANSSSGSLSVHQGTYTPPGGGSAVPVPAADISFAGQTALKFFSGGAGISLLNPGSTATFVFPLYTAGNQSVWYSGGNTINNVQTVTATYSAPADPVDSPGTTLVQLASKNFTTVDKNPNNSSAAQQTHSALRIEWHGEGSVQGELDLINDQVGFYPGQQITPDSGRGPSGSNITYVNQNQYNSTSQQGPLGGLQLSNTGYGNTYNSSVYDLPTGISLVNSANRVQFSVGEYKTEGLAQAGAGTGLLTSSSGGHNTTVFTIGSGYGTGNTALSTPSSSNIAGLGVAASRQQFQAASIVNLSTDKVDPQSATSQTYGAEYGTTRNPWATAGADNSDSTQFAVTAVGFSANPGTGLSRLNRGSAQWLQTTSRLQNGAAFDFVSRDVNTGQRIVSALNTGVDPSWAVGADDGGNTTGTATNQQSIIGPTIRYSGKTAGSEAESTIASSRLAVGALSLAENRGNSNFAAPIRNLDVDFNSQNGQLSSGTNSANDGTFFSRINFDNTISNDDATRWKAVLISHFNTIKTPSLSALNAYEVANGLPTDGSADATAWANIHTFNSGSFGDTTATGIKGDIFNNVRQVLANVLNSTGSGSLSYINTGTLGANNPADALFSNGYLIPALLNYTRQTDGGDITPQTGNASEQAAVKGAYENLFTSEATSLAPRTPGANSETIGVGAKYAYYNTIYTGDPSGSLNTNGGSIAITAKNADGTAAADGVQTQYGNWLFGNFNQTGARDFAAVKESVNAVLALHHIDGGNNSIFSADGGTFTSTPVSPAPFDSTASNGWAKSLAGTGTLAASATKGDLITLGDANADGKFDGKDVYLLARGAALSDNPSLNAGTDTLTTASGVDFSDQLTNMNDKLNKNAALQDVQNRTTALVSNDGYNTDRAWLRSSGRNTFTGSSVPLWATSVSGSGSNIVYTYDPTGKNTFNERDVNRDGQINLDDAFVVDKFAGLSVGSINDQLGAAINVDGSINPVGQQRSISLVDVYQIDSNTSPRIGQADEGHLGAAGTGTLADSAGLNSTFNYAWYSANEIGNLKIDAEPSTGSQFAVPTGTTFTVSSGQFVAGGAVDLFTDNTSGAGGTTPGTHLSIVNNAAGTDGSNGTAVSPYGLVVNSTAANGNNIGTLEGTGNTLITTGGKLTAAHIRQNTLAVGAGGSAAIRSNGTPTGTSVVTNLSVDPTGTLDLNNNALIVTNTTQFGSIQSAITAASDSGLWDKPGISSSIAASHSGDHGLAYALASTLPNGGSTSFNGISFSDAVLVRYTLIGDTNLKGSVDLSDYSKVVQNFGKSPAVWSDGNFDYSGTVGLGDYTKVVLNFGRTDATALSNTAGPSARQVRAASNSLTLKAAAPAVIAATDVTLTVNLATGSVTLISAVQNPTAVITAYTVKSPSGSLIKFKNSATKYLGVSFENNPNVFYTSSNSNQYHNWTGIKNTTTVIGEGFGNSYTATNDTTWTNYTLPSNGYALGKMFLQLTSGGVADLSFQWDDALLNTYTSVVDYVGGAVPEPTSVSLLPMGAVGLLGRRRRRFR